MKKRSKLIVTVLSLIICLCTMTFGVLAATTVTMTVNGSINFVAYDCEIWVSSVKISNSGDANGASLLPYYVLESTDPVYDKHIKNASINTPIILGDIYFDETNYTASHNVPVIKLEFMVKNFSPFPVSVNPTFTYSSNDYIIAVTSHPGYLDANTNSVTPIDNRGNYTDTIIEIGIQLQPNVTTVSISEEFAINLNFKKVELTPDELFTFNASSQTITSYNSDGRANVVVPKAIGGTTVLAIGDAAFDRCTDIITLALPSSITTINTSGIRRCSNMQTFYMPNSVTTLGTFACAQNIAMTNFCLSPQVTVLDTGTLGYSSSLQKIILPDGITSMGQQAMSFSGYRSLVLPTALQNLVNAVFVNCTNLSSVGIKENINTIGDSTFYGCPLTNLVLPESDHNVNLGQTCFYDTRLSGEFYLPNNYTLQYESNGQFLLTDITSFKTSPTNTKYITINGIIYLRKSTNSASSDFNVPLKLEAYPQRCTNTTYTIPSTVTQLRRYELAEAKLLQYIYVEAGNTAYTSIDGILADATGQGLLTIPYSFPNDTYSVPNGVKVIGAVYDVVNNSVSGGGYGFGNSTIKHLTLPTSVIALAGCSLQLCESLLTVNSAVSGTFDFSGLPNLYTLQYKALENCVQMKVLKLGTGVQSLGDGLFLSNNSNLETIYCYATVPPVWGYGSYAATAGDNFKNLAKLTTIYVPNASVAAYKAASGWSAVADKIVGI